MSPAHFGADISGDDQQAQRKLLLAGFSSVEMRRQEHSCQAHVTIIGGQQIKGRSFNVWTMNDLRCWENGIALWEGIRELLLL